MSNAILFVLLVAGAFLFFALIANLLNEYGVHRHRWIPSFDKFLYEECTVCHKVRMLPDSQE